jgi:hypothetical protein
VSATTAVPSGRISEGSSSKRFTSGRILHATTRRAGNRVYTFAGSRWCPRIRPYPWYNGSFAADLHGRVRGQQYIARRNSRGAAQGRTRLLKAR